MLWGKEGQLGGGESDEDSQQQHPPSKKKEDAKKSKNKGGRTTTTRPKSRSGSLVKEEDQSLGKASTTGTPSDESREESSEEGPAKGQEEAKRKTFLKRKRQKIKMYKIPNYSHVKSVVDSRHEDDLQEQQPQGTFMYTQARPSTAPPMQTQQQEKPTGPASPLAAQQNDSPIDDLKKILGLKQNSNSHGKENALPRSSAARKGHSRRWKGKSVSSSTHLNISGTVARLFSSSVQRAKESILTFEQTDIDAETETSQVPRAVQKINQAGEEQVQTGSTSGGGGRGSKYQYGVQYNLRKLVEQPELVEKIKSETRNLEDFVKPRELSFVHLDMTRD